MSDRDGAQDVWTMLADGTGLNNITRSASSDDEPSW